MMKINNSYPIVDNLKKPRFLHGHWWMIVDELIKDLVRNIYLYQESVTGKKSLKRFL